MIAVNSYTLTCACGPGIDSLRTALRERRSGLRHNDFPHSDLETWIGRVAAADEAPLPEEFADWESRNNRLVRLGLAQDDFMGRVADAVEHFGAHRVGAIIGTSTSSIGRTEEGYRRLEDERMPAGFLQPDVHNPHSPTAFVVRLTGIRGPAMTISTACSSSAKVFASADRWLAAGIVDAVVVGGADSLCLSVLHGFHSLELTSTRPCRPFDANRDGISIGEAAGFALVTREGALGEAAVRMIGYGESVDAHHMSHPHPEGLGARLAMEAAIDRAGLRPDQIDYVNLHGTASRANDAIEARVLNDCFEGRTLAGSTKGWTGHALGAAGIVETMIAMDSLVTGLVPGTLNTESPDEALDYPILIENHEMQPRRVMSNSFGFGGNNCCVIFEGAR